MFPPSPLLLSNFPKHWFYTLEMFNSKRNEKEWKETLKEGLGTKGTWEDGNRKRKRRWRYDELLEKNER